MVWYLWLRTFKKQLFIIFLACVFILKQSVPFVLPLPIIVRAYVCMYPCFIFNIATVHRVYSHNFFFKQTASYLFVVSICLAVNVLRSYISFQVARSMWMFSQYVPSFVGSFVRSLCSLCEFRAVNVCMYSYLL